MIDRDEPEFLLGDVVICPNSVEGIVVGVIQSWFADDSFQIQYHDEGLRACWPGKYLKKIEE